MSLANQGKLERPITSSRLQELLRELIGNNNTIVNSKSSINKNVSSQNKVQTDNIASSTIDKTTHKSEN